MEGFSVIYGGGDIINGLLIFTLKPLGRLFIMSLACLHLWEGR